MTTKIVNCQRFWYLIWYWSSLDRHAQGIHRQDILPCASEVYLDSSLYGVMGKIEGKEQGLTLVQWNVRYERQRDKDSHISKRKNEYFVGKGASCWKWWKVRYKTKYHVCKEGWGKLSAKVILTKLKSAKEVKHSWWYLPLCWNWRRPWKACCKTSLLQTWVLISCVPMRFMPCVGALRCSFPTASVYWD